MWKQHFLHRREKKSVVKFSRMRRCTRLDTARTFGIYPKVRLEISVVRGSRDSRHGRKVFFRVGEDDLCGYSRNIGSRFVRVSKARYVSRTKR